MISAKVVKSQNGRDMNSQFSNTYLLTGGGVWNGQPMIDTVKEIASAEIGMYPTLTYFLYVLINNLDADMRPLRGQFLSIPLDLRGTVAIPADDKVAPSNEVAAFNKRGALGRPGVSLYRNMVFSKELDLYHRTGAVPLRFKNPDNLADVFRTNFTEALLNITGGTGAKLALPDAYGDAANTPRPITAIQFAGFRDSQETRQKISARASLIMAIQKAINEKAANARFAARVDKNGVLPDRADVIVNRLQAEATALFNAQPADVQSRLIWPEIFDNNPLTGGA